MSTAKINGKDNDKSIEQLMAELDEIVSWFNTSDIDIEQATKKFDEGVALAEAIKKRITETENKVNLIKQKLADYEAK